MYDLTISVVKDHLHFYTFCKHKITVNNECYTIYRNSKAATSYALYKKYSPKKCAHQYGFVGFTYYDDSVIPFARECLIMRRGKLTINTVSYNIFDKRFNIPDVRVIYIRDGNIDKPETWRAP